MRAKIGVDKLVGIRVFFGKSTYLVREGIAALENPGCRHMGRVRWMQLRILDCSGWFIDLGVENNARTAGWRRAGRKFE